MDPPKTEEWIVKARKGDRSAFDELVNQHRGQLAALVRGRLTPGLQQRIDIEDVLQEAFLRAFRSIDRFQYTSEESFFRWLGGIANNVIREIAKRQKWEVIVPLEREPSPGQISPSKAGRRNERFDRLQSALLKLSPEHRQVVMLARIDRLPLKEVARRMKRSPGAVKQLLLRALKKVRESFGSTDSYHLPQRTLHDKEENHVT